MSMMKAGHFHITTLCVGAFTRRDGGIGRRDGLKIRFPQGSEGSIPSLGTRGAVVKKPGQGRPAPPLEGATAQLLEAVDSFLGWCELERGLSENTAQAYEGDLRQCAAFLVGKGVRRWEAVDGELVSEWFAQLTRAEFSPGSRRGV